MNYSRRKFLQQSVGVCAASALAGFGFPFGNASSALAQEGELKIVPFALKVGATKPFKAIHVSDTHLCFADERDNERKNELAKKRSVYFRKGEANLLAAAEYARKQDALFVHTGDMIDFVSAKNCDYAAAFYGKEDVPNHFVSAGNHEFSQYVGEAKEDEAYKAQSFEQVQKAFPNDLKFASKIVNGVNFIAFDDVYYYVAEDLKERFQKEVDKGLPIVAMCHVPLYTPEQFNFVKECGEKSSYLIGVPNDVNDKYKQKDFSSSVPNQTTLDFIDWLKKQTLLKALLTGHLHVNHDSQFSETARQYVVGGNFGGDVYEFSFE